MERLFSKKALVAIIAIYLPFLTPLVGQNLRERYIVEHREIAIKHMEEYGIPASITLAQACLESGFGESYLAKKANNHFGIKCHDWKGPSVRYDDDAKGECFRKYKSVEESFVDHSHFLRYRSRYSSLFNLNITDYKGWAHGLQAAGYATNPKYAALLIELIERYSLQNYDQGVISTPTPPDNLLALHNFEPSSSSQLYKVSLERKLYQKSGVACIVVQEGESYRSIAKEFNLFTRELLRFNDLKKEIPLKRGTLLYIEKKRKESDPSTPLHVASGDESLWEISQKYGVRLNSLAKLNKLKRDSTPFEGSTIKLRR